MSTKIERAIMEDVTIGTTLLDSSDHEIEIFIETIEAKYSEYISGLKGIHYNESVKIEYSNRSWKESLQKVINILETSADLIQIDGSGRPKKNIIDYAGININNSNNNENSNKNNNLNTNTVNTSIEVNVMIENAKDKIVEELSGLISEEDLKKSLEKLEFLKEISMSNDPHNKKWTKLKDIFSWLTTQGVSIFTTITPIILKILEKN